MPLNRREFVTATASIVSLFPFAAQANPSLPTPMNSDLGELRHIHLELPAGPYARASLSQTISGLSTALNLPTPVFATALGTPPLAETYPAEFALTLHYPDNLRLVVRASRVHAAPAEVVLRGSRGSLIRPLGKS